jgi:ribose/xylose/arabinose/galactoside ABC-type transport system permease subunit
MTSDTMTSPAEPRLRVWLPALRRNAPVLFIYGILLIMIIGAFVASGDTTTGQLFSDKNKFLSERNIFNVLRQAAFLGTAAIGQTLVILTGGIDLSVGSVVKLSVIVSAILMDGKPENVFIAIIATLLLGVVTGVGHALIITRLNVSPFIVTLGSYSILRGISLAIAAKPVGRAAPGFLSLYDAKIGPVPVLVVFFALLLIAVIVMLRRTTLGRYIYAIGGSEQVAQLSGIPITRVKFSVYVLCSLLAAVTGLLFLIRNGVGGPETGENLELQTITAVILGGTSLFGGSGGVIGTLGGVLLLGLTNNLFIVLRVNQWIQDLIEGLIIVGAVALYKQKGRH